MWVIVANKEIELKYREKIAWMKLRRREEWDDDKNAMLHFLINMNNDLHGAHEKKGKTGSEKRFRAIAEKRDSLYIQSTYTQ